MQLQTHACIAYIVGRLISGKNIASLYDYSQSRYIDISSLPEADNLREYNYVNWSYMANPSSITKFQFIYSNGQSLELRIKGNTFIGYVRESSSHFIGNLRGDTIFLYDQKESSHFTYKLSGSPVEH